jgi:hypothetical protein
MKAFEDHQRREGKTVNHGTAKEIIAGFAVPFLYRWMEADFCQGVAVDKFVEDKGLNWVDKYPSYILSSSGLRDANCA